MLSLFSTPLPTLAGAALVPFNALGAEDEWMHFGCLPKSNDQYLDMAGLA